MFLCHFVIFLLFALFCTLQVSIAGSTVSTPMQSAPQTADGQPAYITLEVHDVAGNNIDADAEAIQDHLDMLDSPERVVPDRAEQIGHTLEFLPEDNTVIRCKLSGINVHFILRQHADHNNDHHQSGGQGEQDHPDHEDEDHDRGEIV